MQFSGYHSLVISHLPQIISNQEVRVWFNEKIVFLQLHHKESLEALADG